MHNGWYDVGCYLEFVRGHPYADERLFLAQFTKGKVSGLRKRPSPAAVRLFQRMFMASTIIRPADCVTLPACRKIAFKLDLSPQRAMQVAQLTENYKKTSKLGYAIQAQLYQLHWGLILEKEDEHHPEQDLGTTAGGESNDENTVPNDCTSKKTDGRAQWIKELANCLCRIRRLILRLYGCGRGNLRSMLGFWKLLQCGMMVSLMFRTFCASSRASFSRRLEAPRALANWSST